MTGFTRLRYFTWSQPGELSELDEAALHQAVGQLRARGVYCSVTIGDKNLYGWESREELT